MVHAPAALPQGKRARGTDWIGGWVGSGACMALRRIPTFYI
jgi:hypothetical protein